MNASCHSMVSQNVQTMPSNYAEWTHDIQSGIIGNICVRSPIDWRNMNGFSLLITYNKKWMGAGVSTLLLLSVIESIKRFLSALLKVSIFQFAIWFPNISGAPRCPHWLKQTIPRSIFHYSNFNCSMALWRDVYVNMSTVRVQPRDSNGPGPFNYLLSDGMTFTFVAPYYLLENVTMRS